MFDGTLVLLSVHCSKRGLVMFGGLMLVLLQVWSKECWREPATLSMLSFAATAR
jgi:hypothetical protein